MKIQVLTMVLLLTGITQVLGQQSRRETVMYDPLFWKDELSLKGNQYRQIELINAEFYQTLRLLKNEPTREEKDRKLAQELEQRSQKIYGTLLPKQRKKLEKIVDRNAPLTAAP